MKYLLDTNIDEKVEILSVKEQIVSKYTPLKIILFGSQVKGTATKRSDIDCKSSN